MAAPVLVPCLVRFAADLTAVAPARKLPDGWIGDTAHQGTVSDHNDDEIGNVPIRDADSKHEVHALDASTVLKRPGLTMEMVVQHVVSRCRSGAEKRLRYVIFNRRIWSASGGWKQRKYSGNSPHIEHAHFSASYDTIREADTASWRLEEIPVALTDADRKWITTKIEAAAATATEKAIAAAVPSIAAAVAEQVWATTWNIEMDPAKKPYEATAGSILAHVPSEHTTITNAITVR